MSVPFRIDRDPRPRWEWEERIVMQAVEELRPPAVEMALHPTLGPMFSHLRPVRREAPPITAKALVEAFPGRFRTTRKGEPHKALRDCLDRLAKQHNGPFRMATHFGNGGGRYYLKEVA